MEAVLAFFIPMIMELAEKQPLLMTVIAILGTFRAVFKPIMTVLHVYTQNTASKSDDEILAKVEESKVFKAIAWLIDYFTSIKIKK